MIATTKTTTKAGTVPAAAYIRMSTGKQEDSPEQQRAEIAKLAAKHNCRIATEYLDEGISGATGNRKDFQRLLADATKGKFKIILCWDQDRFGRFDSIDAGEWIAPLRRAGVRLITVAQGEIDWTDFAGRMMYQIQQEGKHQFLRDLARNVVRGKEQSAKLGEYQGRIPFGYARVFFDEQGEEVCRKARDAGFLKPPSWTSKLVRASDESPETLAWLFDTYAKTETSMASMARELNRRGVPSPRGSTWAVTSLKSMLRNKAYIGTYTLGHAGVGDFARMGATVEIKGAHEPLVDAKTFARVQEKLEGRKQTRTKVRTSWAVLSGILHCGHCGGRLGGHRQVNGNGRYRNDYYACGGFTKGTCREYRVRADFIEAYLVAYVQAHVLEAGALEKIRKQIVKTIRELSKGRPGELKALQTKLAKLELQITKGTERLLLVDAADVPDAKKMLADWRGERDALLSDIDTMKAAPTYGEPEAIAEMALSRFTELGECYREGDVAKARAAFKEVFERVALKWTRPENARNWRVSSAEITIHHAQPLLTVMDGKLSRSSRRWTCCACGWSF